MHQDVRKILAYLQTTQGLDLTSSRLAASCKIIEDRLSLHGFPEARAYITTLETRPDELATLIDQLTVSVSYFFRNPLTFEILAQRILPEILRNKTEQQSAELRIWSAGCASGEEPYSIAILVNELLEEKKDTVDVSIFASDINLEILKKARSGIYGHEQVRNVKHHLLLKYFNKNKQVYSLSKSIVGMVCYSQYDMMTPNTYVPHDCIFGEFDLVLCRNLLIYFDKNKQSIILRKLFRSLAPNGYLVLGEAEHIPQEHRQRVKKCTEYCQIYRSVC